MSIFERPLPVRMTLAEKQRKKLRDSKWRKAAAARRFWSAEAHDAEKERLQAQIDAILAKRAA